MSQGETAAGSIARVEGLLDDLGARRVFLVSGRHAYTQSGARKALAKALATREVVRFDGFSPNPDCEEIERGLELFRASGCDVVLAVGGGSAIDVAKTINACAPSSAALPDLLRGVRSLEGRGLPLIAVPTTAGSGAEATHFAVVYLGDTKCSLTHESLLPDHSILDPDLTRSLPTPQRAATGVDALSQAIEAFWSVRATDASRELSLEAIDAIRPALARAVHDPTPQVRESMLAGAHLAGRAIRVARTTAPHALSYALTRRFGIPHGHAVGLTLGVVFSFNVRVQDSDVQGPCGALETRERILALAKRLGWNPDDGAGTLWAQQLRELGLEARLGALGVQKSDLPDLVRAVNPERLANNPRRLGAATLGRLLEEVF